MKKTATKYISKQRLVAEEVEREMIETPQMSMVQVFPGPQEFYSHHQMPEGFEIKASDIAEIVKNFENKNGRKAVPVYAGHGYEDRPAYGWVHDLIDRTGEGLWAMVEWNREGLKAIREKHFKFISPEWYTDYTEPETGAEMGWLLTGIALVNEPYFSEMAQVVASEKSQTIKLISNESNMKIDEIRTKSPEELSDEERKFLEDNREQLTEEERASFFPEAGKDSAEEEKSADDAEGKSEEDADKSKDEKSEDDADEKKSDEADADEADDTDGDDSEGEDDSEDDAEGEADEDEDAGDESDEDPAEKVEASEKAFVKMSASEAEQLKKEAAEGRAATEKLIAAEIDKSIEAAEVAPAVSKKAAEIAIKMSPKMRASFFEILKANKGIKTERKTSSESEEADPEKALLNKAKTVASEKNISLGDAVREVRREEEAKSKK